MGAAVRFSGVVVLLCLVVAVGRAGWAPVLDNVCNSAPQPNDTVEVNSDYSEGPIAPGDDVSARLFYSFDNQANWTELPMNPIGTPGYESTYSRTFGTPGSGTGHYYVQADAASCFATQSPFNAGNTWPPGMNLVARVARDDTGDAVNPEGPYLDLTGAYAGYSADRFYCVLTNNSDRWPTSGGLLKWFAYSLGFVNPAAPSDSWVFGPIYVSAWLVMESGLFAINRYTGATPERVGDIDYQIDGNKLIMRCLTSDLVGDSRFGPWPNEQGWLATGANTLTITPGGGATKDTTLPGRFYPCTPGFVVNQNQSPALSQARVVPDSGGTQTEFWFNVRYSDPDSNLPRVKSVVVDDDTLELSCSQHRYWLNVLFDTRQSGFEDGWHRFRFVFSDGMATVESAVDSFFVDDGVGVAEAPGRPIRFAARPNPFSHVVYLALPRAKGSVEVRNSAGRLVRSFAPGLKRVAWEGRDESGSVLPPGVYHVVAPGRAPLRLVKVR